MQNNEDILKELRDVTKNRQSWKSNIDNVAEKLGEEHSVPVNAKALWLLGEMGLKRPKKIERHVEDIASYMKDENPKLRERSVNAVGRIGRGDEKLIIPHLNMLMKMRHNECENVRHAFLWACENIASTTPELFCEKLDIFYEMIGDSSEKVRIEAPEMFRVIGKRKLEYVKAYLTELEWISKNDENPIVRIHSEGAVRITEKTMKKNKKRK